MNKILIFSLWFQIILCGFLRAQTEPVLVELKEIVSAPAQDYVPTELNDGSSYPKKILYADPSVLIDLGDIQDVQRVYNKKTGDPELAILLNEVGRKKLLEFTETHLGQVVDGHPKGSQLGLFIDATLRSAPYVMVPLGNGKLQFGASNFTEDELLSIVKKFNANKKKNAQNKK